ncbi:hypothetical protein N44_01359 [Microcystis aeruginosa NIES-44]|uniref:Uncharacterized protein n=1 Tax=Microcystis aeruginosa NIES-44 TaxID=449439 RepID=A0A0A1VU34_MICAE|nr:hypothetical protein N44_01359 [Microcystis aeruginosa NIES-44]
MLKIVRHPPYQGGIKGGSPLPPLIRVGLFHSQEKRRNTARNEILAT